MTPSWESQGHVFETVTAFPMRQYHGFDVSVSDFGRSSFMPLSRNVESFLSEEGDGSRSLITITRKLRRADERIDPQW